MAYDFDELDEQCVRCGAGPAELCFPWCRPSTVTGNSCTRCAYGDAIDDQSDKIDT